MFYNFNLYNVKSLSFIIINRYKTSRFFINYVYSSHDLTQAYTFSNFFRNRAILYFYNDFVNLLN